MEPSPWAGCDPRLASAITAFSKKWGPYSAQSRKYSIFSLLHELIDPAWHELCEHFPALAQSLDEGWAYFLDERFRNLQPDWRQGEESPEELAERWRKAVIPCGGKINGRYSLSALARYHNFDVLDRFLRLSSRLADTPALVPSIDSLCDLVLSCQLKKSKKLSRNGVNARRALTACRLCGRKTEVSSHLDGDTHEPADGYLRLSTLYCNAHRPKVQYSDAVSSTYRTAKRNQGKFDKEFSRLFRQSRARAAAPQAKSGNQLVDEFISRLVEARQLGVGHGHDTDTLSTIENRVRDEARRLVDRKISDRKKEIVALLANGYSQSSAAIRLGIKNRQTVSKALQSIPMEYRLDLLGCER